MERMEDRRPELLAVSVCLLGKRRGQEDVLDHRFFPGGFFAAAVCDGMGGLNGGAQAAGAACSGFMKACAEAARAGRFPDLKAVLRRLDEQVAALTGADGLPLDGGTTLTGVCLRGNRGVWASVGDSMAGIFRNGQLSWLSRRHDYRMVLDGAAASGAITREQYEAELPRGDALVSFLGHGRLPYVDGGTELLLEPGDTLILCSDGFCQLLDGGELPALLKRLDPGMGNLRELLIPFLEKEGKGQDNASAVLIRRGAV